MENRDITRQIVVEVYNYEDFLNAVGEIKSALDYDNIEYNYRILEGKDLVGQAPTRLNSVKVGNIRELKPNEFIKKGDFLQFLTLEEYEDFGEEITDIIEKFAGEMVEVIQVGGYTNEFGEKTFVVSDSMGNIVTATSHEFSKAYREKE